MAHLGEIQLFAGNYAPIGWRFCDGGEIDTWQNIGLYGIVAATQGENWQNDTFYLPDLRGLESNTDSCRYIICIQGDYPGPP